MYLSNVKKTTLIGSTLACHHSLYHSSDPGLSFMKKKKKRRKILGLECWAKGVAGSIQTCSF